MTEKIYPVDFKYSYNRVVYIKYDNKSPYDNLSKNDKEEIRRKVINFIKGNLDSFDAKECNLSFEIKESMTID